MTTEENKEKKTYYNVKATMTKEDDGSAGSSSNLSKKRKSSGDPPDDNDKNSNEEFDISKQGPVKGFCDLMRIARYVHEKTPKKKKTRKRKKPAKEEKGVAVLSKILPYLEELDSLVGLKDLKDQIALQIVFFIQDLNTGNEMMHTAIMGPPGMCKTTVSEIS